MKIQRLTGLVILTVALVMGCSGNYGTFKNQTRSESKETKQQLIDSWADYDIGLIQHTGYKPPRIIGIIFDTKNDDVKLLVEGNLSKVDNPEMWTEIVKENTASDGEFTLVWGNYGPYYSTGVQEVWGPDNQLYGFIIYQEYAAVFDRVELVDENTIRLSGHPPAPVGGK